MYRTNPFTRRHVLPLLMVLLVAAFLRLDKIIVSDFRFDTANLSLLALDFVSGKEFPTKGLLSSQGVHHPPMMVFVAAIPYAITAHPIFGAAFVALLNLLGVAMLYAIAHRYFNPTVAFIGGMAYAVAPWSIIYSRSVWPQSMYTPFLLAGILLGLYGFVEGSKGLKPLVSTKWWAQAFSLPIFFLAPQIHFGGMALIPLPFIIMWMGRKQISWSAVELGILLTLLTTVPFWMGFDDEDIENVESFLVGDSEDESEGLSIHSVAVQRSLNMAAGVDLENRVSKNDPQALLDPVPRPTALWYVLAALCVVGAITVWRSYRRMSLLLYAWVGLLILATSFGFVWPNYHYINLIVPALMLFIGIGAAWLHDHLPAPRYSHLAVYAALAVIFLTQAVWWGRFMRYADEHTLHNVGTPLHYQLAVREQALTYEDVLIVGGGADSNWDIWKPLLYHTTCVREAITAEAAVAVFPAGPFAVIYPSDAQSNPLDEIVRSMYTAGDMTVYPMRSDETPYRVFTYGRDALAWPGPPMIPVEMPPFDNGAQVVGYQLDMLSGRAFLEWRLTPPQDDAPTYQYFMHFLNADGERVGQRDTSFWPGKFWCAGDKVITWTNADIPPDTAIMRVGMYLARDGGFVNADVLDAGGNPAGQWLEIYLADGE